MTLIEKEEIIMGDDNTAEVLNTFFSAIVSNLKIEGFSNCDSLANNIRDPVFKCIVKKRNHPNTLAMEEVKENVDIVAKLSKRMRIYSLKSLFQILMILPKNQIFYPY